MAMVGGVRKSGHDDEDPDSTLLIGTLLFPGKEGCLATAFKGSKLAALPRQAIAEAISSTLPLNRRVVMAHQQPHIVPTLYGDTIRFSVSSTDVLEDLRINVTEQVSGKVIWYKKRFLSGEEVVDNIVHEPTNSICWTVHRPIHGWYIRLRSPSFPPETYISLSPVSHKSFLYVEGALSFTSRTNSLSTFVMPVDEEEHRRFSLASPSQPRMSMSSIMTIRSTKTTRTVQSSSTERAHSYPPIPSGPTVNVLPPSPKSVASRLSRRSSSSSTYSASSSQSSPSTIRPSTQTQLSTFILSPTINQIPLPASNSYFARAISLFQYHRPRQNNSFTLSRIPAPMPQYISPAPSMSNLDLPNSGAAALVNQNTDEVSDDTRTVTLDSQEDPSMRDIHIPPLLRVSVSGPPAHSPSSSSLSPSYPVSSSLSPSTPSPDSSAPPPLSLPLVMRFVDETPIFTVGSTMGAFELDQTEVKALGIDMSYWIAVGLTYLDFLENKASYLAALED